METGDFCKILQQILYEQKFKVVFGSLGKKKGAQWEMACANEIVTSNVFNIHHYYYPYPCIHDKS